MQKVTKVEVHKKCANCKFLVKKTVPVCRWHNETLERRFLNKTYCDAHEFFEQ